MVEKTKEKSLKVGESIDKSYAFHLLQGDSLDALCGVSCRVSGHAIEDWEAIGTQIEKPCLGCQVKAFGWPEGLDDQQHPLNLASHFIDLYGSLEVVESNFVPLLKEGETGKTGEAKAYCFAAAVLILRTAEKGGTTSALHEANRLLSVLEMKYGIKDYVDDRKILVKQLFTELYSNWRRT